MRILQVIPSLARGGAESVVVELSNELILSGNSVSLLTLNPLQPKTDRETELNTEVKRFSMGKRRKNYIQSYFAVILYILSHKKFLTSFDVIHFHLTLGQFFSIVFKLVTFKDRPITLYTCHNVGANSPFWQNVFDKIGLRFVDKYVLVSINNFWIQTTRKMKTNKVFLIENGISLKTIIDSGRFTDFTAKELTVGTISRLQIERSPWKFLEVFNELKKLNSSRFRFMIGGDGPLLQDLKIIAKSQNFDVENIFVGQIESAEKFLQQIDIYVSLNTGSVTGIAGLEAVFSGIPVVALQTLPDYIAKHSDWIYSSYTPIEVAIKIHEMATRESIAQSEARTQLKVAQTKFTSSVMSDKYQSLYNSRGSLGTDQKSGQINLLTWSGLK